MRPKVTYSDGPTKGIGGAGSVRPCFTAKAPRSPLPRPRLIAGKFGFSRRPEAGPSAYLPFLSRQVDDIRLIVIFAEHRKAIVADNPELLERANDAASAWRWRGLVIPSALVQPGCGVAPMAIRRFGVDVAP